MKLIICCLMGVAIADLRQASQPKQGYNLLQQNSGRGTVDFAVGTGVNNQGQVDNNNEGQVLYVEPSAFGYQGLENQRQNNYDNFLRSNIDNEQDNRNFDNEEGKDHLPFRSYDKAQPAAYPYQGPNPGDADDSLQNVNVNVATVLRVAPGEARPTPLRWNNPHASEIEVNLWIMCADPPTVVPVKKPTCSGEGNQNNIIEWAIPANFGQVNFQACPSTQCFQGCNQVGDCMLQIYAHSVETRQYSTAVPIIIAQGATPAGTRTLQYTSNPLDANEATTFDWPANFDLQSMVQGQEAGDPQTQNGGVGVGAGSGASLNDIRICASSEKEGVYPNGETAPFVELVAAGTTYPQLNAGIVYLYVCKNSELQIAAEDTVAQVQFSVSSVAETGAETAGPTALENYSPFEMMSTDQFGGASVKKVTAAITSNSNAQTELTAYLDLRGNGKRWRFRRHLQPACPTGDLQAPFPDPWLDLSKLKRVTCMNAQDPNSNYPTTILKSAVLHSDVANHAYQNSDYSPYSGQQHEEISRNMQAAAVIHMASGNRGELGKAAVPDDVQQQLAQLNNQVNQIYQNYEKVANRVIDKLTQAGQVSGGGTTMGPQQLADTFRGADKGATSSKRLKTTTYVPSFNVAGYDMDIIQQAIAQETNGNKASYKDILSAPNPQTGAQYIRIYRATFDRVVDEIQALEATGYGYQESVKMNSCSRLPANVAAKSAMTAGNNQAATMCCNGPLTAHGAGQCGNTLADVRQFRKRNAQNNKDGGVYAATRFYQQQMEAMYNCPTACQTVAQDINNNLLAPLVKTATGTCPTAISGASGCINLNAAGAIPAGSIDCSGCLGRFNNVAPQQFLNDFSIGIGDTTGGSFGLGLGDMLTRVQAAPGPEAGERIVKTAGDALLVDDTAICHTESTFSCPGDDSQYDAMVNAGQCSGTDSVKIDNMCEDGPCDSNPDSLVCATAKANCEVDPETGVKCMPNSENDPCDCSPTNPVNPNNYYYDDAEKVAAVTFASLFVLAAVL